MLERNTRLSYGHSNMSTTDMVTWALAATNNRAATGTSNLCLLIRGTCSTTDG